MELEKLRENLAEGLREKGLEAVTAWGEQRRERAGKAICGVSLRGFEGGTPGFQDFLGERFDGELGGWVEVYGKRMELTFGLDLYGKTAEDVEQGLGKLTGALGEKEIAGLVPASFSAGETVFQSGSGRFFCPVAAKFSVWVTATKREDGEFLGFEVKGERI